MASIPTVTQNLVLGSISASGLQQALPVPQQAMCVHREDGGSCKDEDTHAVQNQLLSQIGYSVSPSSNAYTDSESFMHTPTYCITKCYSIFKPPLIENPPSISTEINKRVKAFVNSHREIFFRLGAVTCSYISVIPLISPATRAFSHPTLKKIFSGGEVIAWGTFFSWSATNIIDRIAKDRKIDADFVLVKKRGSHKIYWLSLIFLGLCSQIPSAYNSYHYNDGNLFWTIFAPTVYSSFAIYSLESLTQKISHTDNWISRFLFDNKNKLPLLRARENFCFLLQECLSALLTSSPQIRERISNLLEGEETLYQERKFFLQLLQEGLRHRLEKLQIEKIWVRKGENFFRLSGALLSLSRPFLQGCLVYKGSKLIIDNDYFSAFMILLAITPVIYLEVDVNRNMYGNLFRRSVHFCSQISSSFYQRCICKFSIHNFKYVPAFLITTFGMGSLTTALRDNIGFEMPNLLLSIANMLTIYLLLANSLMSFSDFIFEKICYRNQSEEKDKALLLTKNIQFLITTLQRMPETSVDALIKDLENGHVGERAIFSILSNANFKNLLNSIDFSVLQIQEEEMKIVETSI